MINILKNGLKMKVMMMSSLEEFVEEKNMLEDDSDILKEIEKRIKSMDDIDEKVDFINKLRKKIYEVSPFEEPIGFVKWEKIENVKANEYNPNKVATPEMKLLYKSIKLDGFTQPIVTYDMDEDKHEVVDGFHRNLIPQEYEDIRERMHGYLPLTVIDKPLDERMGSTIRHNRARGTHQIRDMSEVVIELTEKGWSEEEICEKLGMELDEVVRLKQISGLKEAFSDHEFSKSWEAFEEKYYGDEKDGE